MNHTTTKRWGPLVATCLLIPILVLLGSARFKATAGPTPAFVRSTVAARTGGGNALTTPAIGTASGDLFVVAVSWDGGTINMNVTDNKGNAYSAATTKQVDTRHNQSMQIFYVANGAGGASHTFTATPSTNASYVRVIVHEVSGISSTSALDKTMVVNNEAGAPVSVGPISTAVSGEYVFAAAMNDSGSNTFAPTGGSGFTERATSSPRSSELQSQDMVQVGSGAISSTWTMSGTNQAMAQVVSFRPASAVQDSEAPSAPANLSATAVSPTQIDLSWSASTDNIGVAGYSVYRNGTKVATPASNSYQDSSLTQGTSYTYTISAYDAAGNTSASSAPAVAATPAPSPDDPPDDPPPPPPPPAGPITAPLKASTQNSHYFVDGNGKAVLLTGSHTWNDFQDWSANGTTHPFDFAGYVNMLTATHQNFTLLWNTELPNFCSLPTGATTNFDVAQMPWQRTGPGTANDGKPKFDLTKFDQSFFDRIRAEVQQLDSVGIYAGVYAYTGEWLNVFRCNGDGFPLTGTNNVNGINDGGGVGALSMTSPNALTAVQDAYVEKLVDTLNDMPNVLWATSEESSANSSWWNNHQIDHIHAYEASKPFRHPVGYGNMNSEADSTMINTNADWIAPGGRISTSANCGSGTPSCKVMINDSDHSYFGMWNDTPQQNRNYVWDNFTNASQVLFMDPYEVYYPRENRNLCVSPVNGICSAPDSRWDNVRDNLGYTRLYADRMNLLAMSPQGSRSSTHNVLANTERDGFGVSRLLRWRWHVHRQPLQHHEKPRRRMAQPGDRREDNSALDHRWLVRAVLHAPVCRRCGAVRVRLQPRSGRHPSADDTYQLDGFRSVCRAGQPGVVGRHRRPRCGRISGVQERHTDRRNDRPVVPGHVAGRADHIHVHRRCRRLGQQPIARFGAGHGHDTGRRHGRALGSGRCGGQQHHFGTDRPVMERVDRRFRNRGRVQGVPRRHEHRDDDGHEHQ